MEQHKSLNALLEKTSQSLNGQLRNEIETAKQIMVFGSSACGLRNRFSDLDLFIVGSRSFHFKSHTLDLLCVTESTLNESRWLESELASHIAAYGVGLKGHSNWIASAKLGHEAVATKRRRLEAYATSLAPRWILLDDVFKNKYVTKLRREVQRLALLEQHKAIPPTRLLDDEWLLGRIDTSQTMLHLFSLIPRWDAWNRHDFECRLNAVYG